MTGFIFIERAEIPPREKNDWRLFVNKTSKTLLSAAVLGLVAGTSMAADRKADKKMAAADLVPCYGINKCGGHGKCGGEGHACAGENKCAGQGWLKVPKDVCEEIQGGSLKPIKKG